MKTRLILLEGWLCLFPILPLSAQLDSFNLSSYKLPEIKRKQLDFNLNSTFSTTGESPATSNNLSLYGSSGISLSTFTNLKNYQGSSTVQLNISRSGDHQSHLNTANGSDSRAMQGNGSIQFNLMNRFFFANELFLEADAAGNVQNQAQSSASRYLNINNDMVNGYDRDDANSFFGLNTTFLVGIGRIEPVQDARLAVYILDDLQKLNKLSRIPNNEEILEFSALISRLLNTRYFDFRLHKIEELKAINSFLRDKGLLKEDDIAAFSAINDNLDYSQGPERLSGSKFFAGIMPGLTQQYSLHHDYYYDSTSAITSTDKTHQLNHNANFAGIAGFEYNKPLKLYWQFKAGMNAQYASLLNRVSDLTNSTGTKEKTRRIIPMEFISIAYYPNSRTNFSGGISFYQTFNTEYYYTDGSNKWVKGFSTNIFSEAVNLNFYYYISPQLRFYGSWELTPNYTHYITSSIHNTRLDQDLRLGIIYSIF